MTLLKFYFPSWKVDCDGRPVRAFPNLRNQLLSFEASGRLCRARLTMTASEQVGAWLSAGALVAMLGLAFLLDRARRRAPGATRPGRAAPVAGEPIPPKA